jgi:two-component system sensor histidine kinase/response regulator
MELLLWRWSTAVQVTSMIMIAVFFAALSRSVRRPEMRLWACAWLADLAALVLALGFWYFQPDPRYHHPFFAFYLGAKVAFVVLLLQGAWVLRGKGGWLLRNRLVVPAAALFSIITAFAVQSTDQLGLVTYPVLALVLLGGVVPLARPLSSGTAWLAAGLLTRAVLLLVETAAYAIRLTPSRFPDLQAPIRLFISAASSFDNAAEWLIALGCVLAISNRIQRELRESNAELLAAQALAEEASLAKSVFLSNMSHELRTPLNAVIGFAQLMARSQSLGAQDRESVAIIRRSGEHLLGLINEVLSISKIEAGKLFIERRPFDPRKMIMAVASMIRGRAADAGLELAVDLDPQLPRAVLGDEGKLRQALLNLLGNAVKFTASGTVTIRARWSDGRATFEVSDTGYGIAESELPRLFEPFVQTESGRQAREGTGLGLAITRQLVKLMGGEIAVTSGLGVGTTFRFEADLPLAAETVPETDASRIVGFDGAPLRILVVDDTRESRTLLRKLLEDVGFVVDEAANGAEAVKLWNEIGHPLIFMDNRMPIMDGSEATEAIRGLESEQRRTLIVAVTASVFEHERGTILARGADDVVMKPFAEEKIFEVIATRLGVRFRRAGRRVLLVDDEAISRRVTGEMLRSFGLEVMEASSGAEALARLETFAADVVLLDLEMPQMNGRKTLAAIRERRPALPVIVLTAHDSEEAMVDGMSGYLAKPIDEEAAAALLGRYVNVHLQPTALAELEQGTALRVAEGLRRASGNAALYRDLLRAFRDDCKGVVARLRSGSGDEEAIAMLLHSLRGSAATIGAAALAAEANALEVALEAGRVPALDSFTRALDETLAAIDAYAPAEDVPLSMAAESRGGESLTALTRRLHELLTTNDLSALDCYRQLRAQMGTPSVLHLGTAIEALDFEAARGLLVRVTDEIQATDAAASSTSRG